MRYRREHLEGRMWHKIIVQNVRPERIAYALRQIEGEHMTQSGGHWHLLMLEMDADVILLELLLCLDPGDYRGYGDWSKKKYYSAKTNRIKA